MKLYAIPFDKPNCTDSKKCITCMCCTSNCPQEARALPPVLVSVAGVVMKSKLGAYKKNTLYF